MECNGNVTTKIGPSSYFGKNYDIYLGKTKIARLIVSDRLQSNGHKRPRNLAVYVTIDVSGYHTEAKKAITVVEDMGLDSTEFVELLAAQGWLGELPPKGQSSFL